MSLQQVFDRRLFDDARTDTARALYYVRAAELGFTPSADRELMQSLKSADSARVQVVGPSGAGKTSLIMRVLGDLHAEATDPKREVLVLKVGDRPENLRDPAAVIKLVLDTLRAQRFRFSNIEEGVLEAAAADQTVAIPRQETHQFGIDTQLVTYSTTLSNAYEQREFGANAASLRQDLEDVLRVVAESGYRPVLVLDDTEKFVAPGDNGDLDVDSVADLYHHGVRVLADFEVDLVVATHPRFDAVAKVVEVCDRIGPDRIEVPRILPDKEAAPMKAILTRRLERGGIGTPLEEVIDAEAISALTTLYHDRKSDLRAVLRIAHGAAELALARDSSTVQARDVDGEIVETLR
jgi:Cdc6-like AAA superfamily ATPase